MHAVDHPTSVNTFMMIKNRIDNVYRYFEPNLTLIGYIGLIGFPLYYFVWHCWFPQPYENLPLRLFCGALFLPFILRERMPYWFTPYKSLHFVITITISLPFFFSYMLLMNNWSIVWIMSFMTALFLSILLVHDIYIISMIAFLGLAFGTTFAHCLQTDITNQFNWDYIAVISFAYITGIASHYRNHVHYKGQVLFARSFSAGIAHEMRNPFSALFSSMELMLEILSEKEKTHQCSQDACLNELKSIIRNNMAVINNSNETINLLLSSINEHAIAKETFQEHSLVNVIKSAIESYGYDNANDRQCITMKYHHDDYFLGSDILFRYVFFNLMKNAFFYKDQKPVLITITIDIQKDNNIIKVKDTGIGISQNNIDAIFNDFFTHGKKNSSGLGLPFCKKVITAFGGTITCQSKLSEWTEFTIQLPKVTSKAVDNIKHTLLLNKQLLYIGTTNEQTTALYKHAFIHGYRLNIVNPQQLDTIESHLTHTDLLVVNVDDIAAQRQNLAHLQHLLSLSTTRTLYLTRAHSVLAPSYSVKANDKIINLNTCTEHVAETICRYFFIPYNPVQETQHTIDDSHTILLVDDNTSLRMYTAILLERQGFRVIQTENGVKALAYLATHPADLIIMDLEMPLMGGLETTKQIRTNPQYHRHQHIPIICFSASLSAEQQQEMRHIGMNNFLVKPATKTQLLNTVTPFLKQ